MSTHFCPLHSNADLGYTGEKISNISTIICFICFIFGDQCSSLLFYMFFLVFIEYLKTKVPMLPSKTEYNDFCYKHIRTCASNYDSLTFVFY